VDTGSAVADGRVYTDSLTPFLYRFILTRFILQLYHGVLAIFNMVWRLLLEIEGQAKCQPIARHDGIGEYLLIHSKS
jgi:hypothetical protein